MSLLDQKALLMSVPPFDLLGRRAIETLMAQMDIAYYPKDTVLIAPRVPADALCIVIKGVVHETIDEELQNVYGPNDSFDANALIYGKTESTFRVVEDLICYELPKESFLNLLQDEKAFEQYYMQDFITKHQRLKERQHQHALTPFMMSKIDDIYLHRPCWAEGSDSIRSALMQMEDQNAKVILVKDNGEIGIVTDTDLRRRVLMAGLSIDTPIAPICSQGVLSIDRNDFLFNALLMFTKHGVKRLAVTEKDRIVGILEQLDLLSYFANHTHPIAASIDRAKSIEDLETLQHSLMPLITSLTSKGVKVRYVAKLVSELNGKMYRKLFEMVVPLSWHPHCTLIVMGSEGREEQIVRSDQDNGLIVDTDEHLEAIFPYMQNLSDALVRLGFPPCAGKVMVNNPFWSRSVSGYKKAIASWIDSMDEASLLALSIFMDARSVAGESGLLDECTAYLRTHFEGRSDIMAHLGKKALAFETPLSFFSGFVLENTEHRLDLKKGGIFAIVHGIRVLAMEYKLYSTNTILRIKELHHVGVFDKGFAAELVEAYDTLQSIRLSTMLQNASYADNHVNPNHLSKIERDLLKDAFKIVNTFKKFLTYHYHLEMVV